MVLEHFVTQRVRYGAPTCTLCGGKVMNGLACTCCVEAMWLYRASQGRITTTSCHIRDLTNDCVGGNNLRQMQAVSVSYGITKGQVYQPASADAIFDLVMTNRYGSHLDISYAPVVGTPQDAFAGQFRGNHDIYLSRKGDKTGTIRVGDPGAQTFADWPISLLRTAAGRLDLGSGVTLNAEAGGGKAYAYVTPPDPVTHTWWPTYAGTPPSTATFAVQFRPGTYPRYDSIGRRIGSFTTAAGFTAYGNSRRKVGTRVIGKLITARPGIYVDVHSAATYWSK